MTPRVLPRAAPWAAPRVLPASPFASSSPPPASVVPTSVSNPGERWPMHGIGRREEIRVAGMPEPISHFTNVVRAGRLVFGSGGVGSAEAVRAGRLLLWPGGCAPDGGGRRVGGNDATAQARQVHENLKRCLAAAGATFAAVCKVTVFLKKIADREKVNIARKEYFGPHRPASTLVEISRLVRDDLLVEIEAIAVLPD